MHAMNKINPFGHKDKSGSASSSSITPNAVPAAKGAAAAASSKPAAAGTVPSKPAASTAAAGSSKPAPKPAAAKPTPSLPVVLSGAALAASPRMDPDGKVDLASVGIPIEVLSTLLEKETGKYCDEPVFRVSIQYGAARYEHVVRGGRRDELEDLVKRVRKLKVGDVKPAPSAAELAGAKADAPKKSARDSEDSRSASKTIVGRSQPAKAPAARAPKKAPAAQPPPMFGTPLSLVMLHQKSLDPSARIPRWYADAMNHLLTTAVSEVGLFRLSGNSDSITALKAQLNRGEAVDFATVDDPHVVSGLMKSFLRDLPLPLLTEDRYDTLLAIPDLPEEHQVSNLRAALSDLEDHAKYLLVNLCHFLWVVSLNGFINKMFIDNLGKVIAPNILYQKKPEGKVDPSYLLKMQRDCDRVNMVGSLLIRHCQELFPGIVPQLHLHDPAFLVKIDTGHEKSVQDVEVVITQSGASHLWTSDTTGAIKFWDMDSYCPIEARPQLSHTSSVMSMVHVAGVVWVGYQKELRVYSAEDSSLVAELPWPTFHLIRTPAAMWAAGQDAVNVYDLGKRTLITSIPSKHTFLAGCATTTHVWLGSNKAILIFDIASHALVAELPNTHTRKINSIICSSDGRVWSCSDDFSIAVWDSTSFEKIATIENAHAGKVLSLVESGGRVFSAGWDKTISEWRSDTHERVQTIATTFHRDALSQLVMLPPNRIVSTSWDKSVCVWRVARTRSAPVLLAHDIKSSLSLTLTEAEDDSSLSTTSAGALATGSASARSATATDDEAPSEASDIGGDDAASAQDDNGNDNDDGNDNGNGNDDDNDNDYDNDHDDGAAEAAGDGGGSNANDDESVDGAAGAQSGGGEEGEEFVRPTGHSGRRLSVREVGALRKSKTNAQLPSGEEAADVLSPRAAADAAATDLVSPRDAGAGVLSPRDAATASPTSLPAAEAGGASVENVHEPAAADGSRARASTTGWVAREGSVSSAAATRGHRRLPSLGHARGAIAHTDAITVAPASQAAVGGLPLPAGSGSGSGSSESVERPMSSRSAAQMSINIASLPPPILSGRSKAKLMRSPGRGTLATHDEDADERVAADAASSSRPTSSVSVEHVAADGEPQA